MPRHLISGDAFLKAIKPGDTRKRISDGDGLFLLLFVKGGSHGWRLSYTVNGQRKLLSMGTYPDTSLARARRTADEARALVSQGIDPSDKRKERKAEVQQTLEVQKLIADGKPLPGTFEAVAREWHDVFKDSWSPRHGSEQLRRLQRDAFPVIGKRPVADITPPELLKLLRQFEERGAHDSAHQMRSICGHVFRYAIGQGLATSDPSRDLRGLLRGYVVRHFPAILEPERLGELLRACAAYKGTAEVRAALQLAPMLMVRPTELRCATWNEFNLDEATWQIPAARMKRTKAGKLNGKPHVVALPRQAVGTLKELHRLTGHAQGPNGPVFPGVRQRTRPISENGLIAALRSLGYTRDEVTMHGFRATARTMLAEQLGFDAHVIELQLAHRVSDALGEAYNRTKFLKLRREMLQAWADYLDKLRDTLPQRKVSAPAPAEPIANLMAA